jgi:TolB-like protein
MIPRSGWGRDSSVIFRFGNFQLDTRIKELHRDEAPVAIVPQAFDALLLLIENRDRLVSKDDLIENVWDGRIVSEAALSSCINAVRRAVGDDGKRQEVIRTLPRRGFRFVQSVEVIGDTLPFVVEGDVLSPDRGPRSSWAGSELIFPDKPSIAVLPFANMSGDPEQAYFSDGITEDIITELSRFRTLFVIARNSSFTFREKDVDVREVGQRLGVQYVIEGSVRKGTNRVRVTAQLADADTGHHLWAERYDRELEDIFAVQDEITQTIVSILPGRLEDAGRARAQRKRTANMTAYDLVLLGMEQFRLLTRDSNHEARELFRKAVELDPQYARAHANLAWTHVADVFMLDRWSGKALELALKGIETALDLDDDDSW